MTLVKICGLTRDDDVRRAARLGAWACGFVLSASPRQVTPERAAWLAGEAGDALTVAVVTTESPDWIADALAQAGLQAVQLSAGADGASVGAVREAAARRGLRPLVIAAADTPDAAAADLTLLDARTAQAYGGTGQALDWAALAQLAADRRGRPARPARPRTPRSRRRAHSRQRRAGHRHPAPLRRRRLQRRRVGARRQGSGSAGGVLRRRGGGRRLFPLHQPPRRPSPMSTETHFGPYGGRYVPETLIPALDELTAAYEEARADAAFQAELARLLADYAGRPDAPVSRRAPLRALRRHRPPQARGPLPHRRPQDQQRPRSSAARQTHGQAPRDRRDRRRPARGGHRHGLRPARPGVRRLHGQRGRPPSGAERGAHAAARRHGRARRERLAHPQGRPERGLARLGRQRARHVLRHRLGRRPGAVPRHGARLPGGDRPGDAEPGAPALRPPAGRGGGLRRRRLQRHGHLPRLPRAPGAAHRRRSRRRRASTHATAPRSPAAAPACCTARSRTCCRTPGGRSPRRTRSRPGWTTPASAPSTPGSWRADARRTPRPQTQRRWRRSRPWPSWRASSLRWRAPTPSPTSCVGPPRRRRRSRCRPPPGAPDAATFDPSATRFHAGDLIVVNLSGRGDKDVHEVARLLEMAP